MVTNRDNNKPETYMSKKNTTTETATATANVGRPRSKISRPRKKKWTMQDIFIHNGAMNAEGEPLSKKDGARVVSLTVRNYVMEQAYLPDGQFVRLKERGKVSGDSGRGAPPHLFMSRQDFEAEVAAGKMTASDLNPVELPQEVVDKINARLAKKSASEPKAPKAKAPKAKKSARKPKASTVTAETPTVPVAASEPETPETPVTEPVAAAPEAANA